MKVVKLGLIGKNISHSFSRNFYRNKITNLEYKVLDILSEDQIPSLKEIFRNFDGISITAPYKRHFYHVVISEVSPEIGIVNTIKMQNGEFIGCLTDLVAFQELFKDIFSAHRNLPIFLIGDGAMGNMVANSLKELNLDFKQFSRKLDNLDEAYLNEPVFYINTCSRGFIFSHELDKKSVFWDFNYNFTPHEKLRERCHYIDGISLLELQAQKALEFWGLSE